jgi:hypothetical protein
MATLSVPNLDDQTTHAQFGPPRVSEVACRECYDTGIAGGSAWTAGSRCEACQGPGPLTRLIRLLGLGDVLAAPPRSM